MQTLFKKILALIIPFILLLIIGLFSPPNKTNRSGLLFSQIDKDDLLIKTVAPRMIFIGGSNLSFGLDCQIIKDSLAFNPINTAINADIGLVYMLRNNLKYIRENDVVIVSPEYQQFYGDFAYGGVELLNIVFDVSPDTKNLLDKSQVISLLRYVPQYAISKLNPLTFFKHPDKTMEIYERSSFNTYGDAYKHWSLPKENVDPIPITGELNERIFNLLIAFSKSVAKKKAKLFITFPCYQDLSYNKSVGAIKAVEKKLKNNNFILLGTPERYKFPNSMIFNKPYHLTREGVIIRTKFLIADIKKDVLLSTNVNPK